MHNRLHTTARAFIPTHFVPSSPHPQNPYILPCAFSSRQKKTLFWTPPLSRHRFFTLPFYGGGVVAGGQQAGEQQEAMCALSCPLPASRPATTARPRAPLCNTWRRDIRYIYVCVRCATLLNHHLYINPLSTTHATTAAAAVAAVSQGRCHWRVRPCARVLLGGSLRHVRVCFVFFVFACARVVVWGKRSAYAPLACWRRRQSPFSLETTTTASVRV